MNFKITHISTSKTSGQSLLASSSFNDLLHERDSEKIFTEGMHFPMVLITYRQSAASIEQCEVTWDGCSILVRKV